MTVITRQHSLIKYFSFRLAVFSNFSAEAMITCIIKIRGMEFARSQLRCPLRRPRLGFYASIRKVRVEGHCKMALPCLPPKSWWPVSDQCQVVQGGWAPPGWFPFWRVGTGSPGWVSAKLLCLGVGACLVLGGRQVSSLTSSSTFCSLDPLPGRGTG